MPRSTPIRDTGLMGRVSGSAKEHTMDIHPLGADMSSGCSCPRVQTSGANQQPRQQTSSEFGLGLDPGGSPMTVTKLAHKSDSPRGSNGRPIRAGGAEQSAALASAGGACRYYSPHHSVPIYSRNIG